MDRINKPRVFLSYSRADSKFLERTERDLRRCQIDTWQDIFEVRAGKPWMKVVFGDGIPNCDAILTYFTPTSIKSPVVEKEVDSTLVTQLQDAGVAFLPYVCEDDLRAKLRIDLQTLHCPAWNDENYTELLPQVVAEVWHSYLERVVKTATLEEENKRLKAEAEVNRLKRAAGASMFTPAEES